jgi:hypothetical protein
MGLSAQNFAGIAPAFGDLDGDGDDDLLIGHTDGTLSYYKNTASTANVQPLWTLDQPLLKAAAGDTINVGYYAAPYIYDINKDTKPDLLVGNQTGQISYFQNSPTVMGPGLTLGTDFLGSIEAVPGNSYSGYSAIWIGRVDSTNTEYLMLGNGLGNISRWSGFQTGNVTAPYTRVDSVFAGIDVGLRSTPTLGDADGDGKNEIIAGNRLGGLNLFRQGPPLTTGIPRIPTAGCMMYPNPAQTQVVITWDTNFASDDSPVQISLFNALGQRVRESNGLGGRRAVVLSIEGLASGVYTCHIGAPGVQQALKLNVIR